MPKNPLPPEHQEPTRDNEKSVFDAAQPYGYIWWAASSLDEVDAWKKAIEPKGAKVVQVEPGEDGVVQFVFMLNKEPAERVLGYTPNDEEWLCLSPFEATIRLTAESGVVAESTYTLAALSSENAKEVVREHVSSLFTCGVTTIDDLVAIEIAPLPDMDVFESMIAETGKAGPNESRSPMM